MTSLKTSQQRTNSQHKNEEKWAPPVGNGLRELGAAAVRAGVLLVPMLAVSGWMISSEQRQKESDRLAVIEAAQSYERMIAAVALPVLHLADATCGRDLYATTCVACHGPTGEGVDGLGKNLVRSDFIAGHSDDFLTDFLSKGRPNARPFPMPPKGGRDDLKDEDMRRIVVYLRGMQDPRRMPELPALVVATTASQEAAALEAAGGDAELAQYIANGDRLFHTTCVACHGRGGTGIKGNGKALAHNDYIEGLDDDELLAFLKKGRDPSDPANTTGVGMPAKGGNPALSEDDLLDIISYLRTLQPGAGGKTAQK
jgi:disulfide bond formation protein DsbB